MLRGRSAAHVACRAGLIVDFVDEPEVVRLRGWVIQIGPGAADTSVLTESYRYWLSLRGAVDESEVARLVVAHEWEPASVRRPSGSFAPATASG